SSPLIGMQGPTAWVAPVYPLLLALGFKLLNMNPYRVVIFGQVLNSIFSALTCWPIYLLAKKLFGSGIALASCWTWVLLPTAILFPLEWIWDQSLSALLLTALICATLYLPVEAPSCPEALERGIRAALGCSAPDGRKSCEYKRRRWAKKPAPDICANVCHLFAGAGRDDARAAASKSRDTTSDSSHGCAGRAHVPRGSLLAQAPAESLEHAAGNRLVRGRKERPRVVPQSRGGGRWRCNRWRRRYAAARMLRALNRGKRSRTR